MSDACINASRVSPQHGYPAAYDLSISIYYLMVELITCTSAATSGNPRDYHWMIWP
ncbi:hypothetical protein M378DRAFT_665593 [Amanita muscaria Koide BX008]|uniref:Uncharacterized protein n=1 Tax=Amanita muscaria (strain Koide BX008) TaxID=946122 RepID=A0A0C2TA37_AMAMK|nr:hypothetical protein M378DRAFT_665593 [Amanita muscaria Koide BX008]